MCEPLFAWAREVAAAATPLADWPGPSDLARKGKLLVDRNLWTNRLDALHARRRTGETLSEGDAAWYRRARLDLMSAAIHISNRSTPSELRGRGALRVLQSVRVALTFDGATVHASTVDLSAGGFAVVLERPPPIGKFVRATLLLRGEAPLTVDVAAVGSQPEGGLHRASFALQDGHEHAREALDELIFTYVLGELVFWDDVFDHLGAS